MQQLRRITDRVARTSQAATDQVAEQLAVMSKRGNKAAKSAYGYVMNHPKSATAVVLGTPLPRDCYGSCSGTAATTQRASRSWSACAARPREPRSTSRPRPNKGRLALR